MNKQSAIMRRLTVCSSKPRRLILKLSPMCCVSTTLHERPMQGCRRRRIRTWSACFRGSNPDQSSPADEPKSGLDLVLAGSLKVNLPISVRRGTVKLARDRVCGRVSGMSTTSNPYRGFRFPAEIINQAVWLCHCFSLSLRDVELILAARGIIVSYETIRAWSLRFGRTYAKTLKRRRPQPGDKWFLDEVFVRIRGKLHYLWRAVDQYGNVLDVLVQSRRNTKAAKRFFCKLLKGWATHPESS
jgi:hypothetical protein